MSQYSISIVIPTFNGLSLLQENLPLLYACLEEEKLDYEIFVCDDASTDETLSFLTETYPDVKILKNENNKGFSPTINLGIHAATKDLIFLLNNDVKIQSPYFKQQFHYFEDEATFGVMGKIIGTEGETQDTAKYPYYKGLKVKGSKNFEPLVYAKNQWIPTFMLSGANALVNRKKLQLLGGFDEIYAPFYWEDVDLSVRAWRLGWKCYYEASAVCIHPTSATIGKLFKKKNVSIISDANKFTFLRLHLDQNKQLRYRLKLTFKYLGCLIIGRKQFLDSYHKYRQKKLRIKESKLRLEKLNNGKELKSLQQVTDSIIRHIEGIDYREF